MLENFTSAWYANNERLNNHLAMADYFTSYGGLVKLLFKEVINPYMDEEDEQYDIDKMTIIDDGDYQGTRIFIIPKKTYQPDVDDYVLLSVYYGSCSCCDTLQAALDIDDVGQRGKDLKMLCLHLLQSARPL